MSENIPDNKSGLINRRRLIVGIPLATTAVAAAIWGGISANNLDKLADEQEVAMEDFFNDHGFDKFGVKADVGANFIDFSISHSVTFYVTPECDVEITDVQPGVGDIQLQLDEDFVQGQPRWRIVDSVEKQDSPSLAHTVLPDELALRGMQYCQQQG